MQSCAAETRGSQRTLDVGVLAPHLRQSSLLQMSGVLGPGTLLFSASLVSPHGVLTGIARVGYSIPLYMSSGALNSGPPVYTASALPTEPCPFPRAVEKTQVTNSLRKER